MGLNKGERGQTFCNKIPHCFATGPIGIQVDACNQKRCLQL